MSATQILVVEDERLVATALQNELEHFGYTVSGIAGSGNEAVRKAVETRPDVVLMDIHLQGRMDGIEAGREIRDRCGIPVVYLSAFADAQTVARASETEAFGYLLKPYEERELQTTIEMAIAKHRAERTHRIEAASCLAGRLARDLNQRISTILADTSLALTSTTPELESHPMLQHIEIAAQRAAELVQRLMMFSTLYARSPAPLDALDLSDFIPGLLHAMNSHLDERIIVAYHPAADLWLVAADELLLGQSLVELALNAGDAMPQGGQLTLEVENVTLAEADLPAHPPRRVGQFVRLRVRDTGRGMQPAVRAHLFEPCFSTKKSGQGAGLGLSLVFAAIEQQHGWIECTSQVDQGTQLDLYLPRYVGQASA
jgi:signal transduction histidine kinase